MKSNPKEKEAEKLTELLAKANNHPTMKAILAEEAAAILEKRTAAAERIEVLTKERDKAMPKLQADQNGKEAKQREAKAALDAAINEIQSAKYLLATESQKFVNSIGREKVILLETAPPALDEAVAFFAKKLAFLRSPGRISFTAIGSERNILNMKKTVKGESNAGAVRSALSYCQAAIKELENMKLSPALDIKKIEKMKAGIPDINIYTESTGEKPLERAPDQLPGRKSDSQMDWELGKLNEKIKKVLKR